MDTFEREAPSLSDISVVLGAMAQTPSLEQRLQCLLEEAQAIRSNIAFADGAALNFADAHAAKNLPRVSLIRDAGGHVTALYFESSASGNSALRQSSPTELKMNRNPIPLNELVKACA